MIPIRPSAALTVKGYPLVACATRLMCTNFDFIFWILKFYVFSNLTAPVIYNLMTVTLRGLCMLRIVCLSPRTARSAS
jgi:hypothetical protein